MRFGPRAPAFAASDFRLVVQLLTYCPVKQTGESLRRFSSGLKH